MAVVPQDFNKVLPDKEILPKNVSPNFSYLQSPQPMLITHSRPMFFVQQLDFTKKIEQSVLREQFFSNRDKMRVVCFVEPRSDVKFLKDWASAWESWAEEYVRQTVVRPSKKKTLDKQSLIQFGDNDQPRLKLSVPNEVLEQLAEDCECDFQDVFSLPYGKYKTVFCVNGVWKNGSGYGLSLKANRIKLVKIENKQKKLKPVDYYIPDEIDGDDGDEIQDADSN